MRVGEVRLYKRGRMIERCDRQPMQAAEELAYAMAAMIAADETRAPVVTVNARDYRTGDMRVRVILVGSY